MVKISSTSLLLTFLLISKLDVSLTQDEEKPKEEVKDDNSKLPKDLVEQVKQDEVQPHVSRQESGRGEKFYTSAELQKILDRIKANKKSNFHGKSEKVFEVVSETIKQANPFRLIEQCDPEQIVTHFGINLDKIKFPVKFLSNNFFDRLSEKSKKNKKDLSTQLDVDIEVRKDGDYIYLDKMLKIGKQNHLNLGDYIYCLGIKIKLYEDFYDRHLIELVRVPLEFVDEISTEVLHKYLNIFKEYVAKSGGALNTVLLAYDDLTGRDIITDAKRMITNIKLNGNGRHIQSELYKKQLEEFKKFVNIRLELFYNEWFDERGRFFVYQALITEKLNTINSMIQKFSKDDTFQKNIDLFGKAIGPKGKAILYMVYMPTVVMLNQIFGPFTLIPRLLLFSDGNICEKILAMPPIIIETTGALFKPILIIIEPFLRLFHFIYTGEYSGSLSKGLDVAASYGISIWGGAFKPKHLEKLHKRQKRNTLKEQHNHQNHLQWSHHPHNKTKVYTVEEASKYTKNDRQYIDAYQGGPPPGGYILGVKNDINFEGEDLVSRIFLSPDFLLKAGGPVFVPFASVLAPIMRVANTLLFGKEPFNKRVSEVPVILKGVPLIGYFSEIFEQLLPFIKVAYQAHIGNLSTTQAIVLGPTIVKLFMSGPLFETFKNPQIITNIMLKFFDGAGGILSVLKQQEYAELPRADHATISSDKESETETIFGDFFGGWLIEYIKAIEVLISYHATFFNGVIGNLINPVKFLDQNIDLKRQPLKAVLSAFDNLSLMYKSCEDKHLFLKALLGGNDPKILSKIGIHTDKMAENGIDAGIFLAGGAKLLDEDSRKKLKSEPDKYFESNFEKIGLDSKKLIENGLLEANDHKLIELGIEINLFFNRALRGSIEDESRFLSSGISIGEMLKAGICPSTFLAVGINAIPIEKQKAIGIKDAAQLTEDNLKALGLKTFTLSSKGISAKRLAMEGLENYAHLAGNLGLNYHILTMSVYSGMNPNKLRKAGFDLKDMVRSNIDTKLLLMGGLRKELKGDLSKDKLLKVGIDVKQINAMGINFNLIADFGLVVLNPINLFKIGIVPMPSCIGILSRHGLQTMTGGADDVVTLSFGFITSMINIVNNMFNITTRIRMTQKGKNFFDDHDRFIGPTGILLYNIIGIEEHGGLFGVAQKAISHKFTTAEILKIFDVNRIVNALAHPKQNKISSKRRIRSHRKSNDFYLVKNYVPNTLLPNSVQIKNQTIEGTGLSSRFSLYSGR